MTKKVAVLVGSLRKGSFTKQIAQNIMDMLPDGFEAQFVEIGNLPLYNQDFDDEGNVPSEYTSFRNTMKEMDAVIFATPEYNRGIPAVLKNALDVGSRPYGENIWENKPAVIISVSPGAISGFGANHQLRQSLVFLNMPVVQQPEAYIGGVTNLLNDEGKVTNEGTLGFFSSIVEAFVELVNKY
ncbi:NADPH-dependent FMN reductase [Companilactobacillus sp. DQM5]|uniref:NADPH-dependent FMN reductase n=1 Tax=Companilactobacillus sp. DQM5 TaxID=3463359 RepID=UPI004058902F